MTLQVSSGKRCRKGFRADGEEHFERLLITEEPKHGAIDLAPGGRFFYTSKEGYKGADSFKIEVCGSFNGKKGCAKMNYAVTVY